MNQLTRTLRQAALSVSALFSASYAGAATLTYSFTGAPVTYTVQRNGRFTISAFGAQGGDALQGLFLTYSTPAAGGAGALARGSFDLSAGQVLRLVVGGRGGSTGLGGGGGGGSFAYLDAQTPLVVGGGGGGAGRRFVIVNTFPGRGGLPGSDGTAGTSDIGSTFGGLVPPNGSGGTGGSGGGVAPSSINRGGGGAGFFGPGGNGDSATGGGSLAQGWAGGVSSGSCYSYGGYSYCSPTGGAGGFGGGGAAGYYSAGGGGGFSGGGGSGWINGGGGGGGSFVAANALNPYTASGLRYGDGLITIDTPEAVPTPDSLALAGAGVAGLAGISALRRRSARGRVAVTIA